VASATVTMVGDTTISAVTGSDGAFDLCARPDFPLEFTVDAPDDYLDGTLSIDRDVLASPNAVFLSLRTLTATRAMTFFVERSLVFDPGAAQIVVLEVADRSALSIDHAHDTAQSGNDDGSPGTFTWTDGAGGRYVLFPNVQVDGTAVTLTGDPMGPRRVPIAAGKVSLVVQSIVFF